MAYAALASLAEIIGRHRLSSELSNVGLGPEIGYLCDYIYPVVQLMKHISDPESSSRSSRGETFIANIDTRLKDAITKLVDVLEPCVLNQCLSQSEILGDQLMEFNVDFHEVEQDIDLFINTVFKIKDDYDAENEYSRNWLPENDSDVVSSKIGFIGNYNSKVVGIGLDDELNILKDRLTTDHPKFSRVLPIYGMAGIGKTTLAKVIYQDSLIISHFETRAWVTIGPTYDLKQILLAILAQTNPGRKKYRFNNDQQLTRYVRKRLEGKRYLLVLDDIWDAELLEVFRTASKYDSSGSRILLTTRLGGVADYDPCRYGYDDNMPSIKRSGNVHNKQFLNKEESWHMFLEKVFAKNVCPSELEKAGRKIVENCEGLPFAIIVVGKHLSKAEKTVEYWNKVAEKKIHVFDDPDDEKVISSSYKYLYKHLQYFFLYMGVFPQGYEIPASKLNQLFYSEGLIAMASEEPVASEGPRTTTFYAMILLEYLVSNSCVLVRQQSSDGRIKTCGLHYIFQKFCITEARKEKFFHVLSNYADSFAQDVESQRRFCIHNNILFAIKDVYDSIAYVPNMRSILCTGPYHQYAVPMCFGLKMLKVIDAVTIRFYNFPIAVLKLLLLKHLSFTYDGNLPHSISKLQSLQYLIVQRHVNLKSRGGLPLGIWKMRELRHLQVMGSDLPDPPPGANLRNLEALIGVSSISCTSEVLSGLPNLNKLGIQFIPSPDSVETFCIFNHFAHFHKLKNIKCVIMNPWEYMGPRCQVFYPPISTKPSLDNLKKLSLSGFGYPWEYMSQISEMRCLEVLKLRCCAFRGPEWTTSDGGFPQLKFLLLEDLDLVRWTIGYKCFTLLKTLIIRHCYKLEKVPPTIGGTITTVNLETMELVDARHSIELSWMKMLRRRVPIYGESPRVRIHSSLDDDKKLKS